MQQEQQEKLVLPKYFHIPPVLGIISLGLGGGVMFSQRRAFLVEKLPILASTPLDWMLLLCGLALILSANVIAFNAARRHQNLARPSPAEQRKHAELIEQRSSRAVVVLTPFSDGARPDALRFMPYTAIPFVLLIGMALVNKRVVNAAGVLILIVLPVAMFLLAYGSPLFCRVELIDESDFVSRASTTEHLAGRRHRICKVPVSRFRHEPSYSHRLQAVKDFQP